MRTISRRLAILVATAAFTVGIPFGVAIAGIGFNDVSPTNPFINDIEAIAHAGVTTGCGGGNYCPKDNVTREQMAAFMNRLGALSPEKAPVVNAAELDGLAPDQFGVGGVRALSDGTVLTWFNRRGGEPTINHAATGRYEITFPGSDFNINLNLIVVANAVGTMGFATVGSVGGAAIVRTYDESGSAIDVAFNVLVFDASTSG